MLAEDRVAQDLKSLVSSRGTAWLGACAFALITSFLFLHHARAQEQSAAKREPVLAQIDLPEPYYYREMYLPQPTTGPNSVAWMPDSRTLVFSMAGSLWRQQVGTESAQQLTASAGYDYQPEAHRMVAGSYM